jgi:hypothetical protein
MNESTFRSLIHEAIGEFEAPANLSSQARVALEHAVQKGPDTASALGNPGAESGRLARKGLADRRTGRRTELAAGIAAVLLAAIVVGTFAYIRAVTHPQTIAPPITPLILFSNPADPYQVDGMTWDGRISGKVTRVLDNGSGVDSSNPAGTLFVAFPNILDRSGRVVAQLTGGPYANPGVGDYFVGTWADDESHYCQSVPVFAPGPPGANPVSGTLQLTTPGGTPRNVAQVGEVSPEYNNVSVAACSVLADRAVVVEADPNGSGTSYAVYQYWVVQLSTGRVLWAHDLRGSKTIARVIASRDGQYVAEVSATGTSTIYGPSGSRVGQVSDPVLAFSWDGSLVVAGHTESEVFDNCPRNSISSCVPFPQPQVIRWRDGATIWTLPAGQTLAVIQPEPEGTSLAIAAYAAVPPVLGAQFSTYPTVLYVVSSNGQVLGQTDVGRIFPSCFCQP